MDDRFQYASKLDGLIVVSSTWNVLRFPNQVNIEKSKGAIIFQEYLFRGIKLSKTRTSRFQYSVGRLPPFYVTILFECENASNSAKQRINGVLRTYKFEQNVEHIKKIQQDLNNIGVSSEVRVLISCLGQDVDIGNLKTYGQDVFDFEEADHYVVHYARDSFKEGKTLFYCKSQLKNILGTPIKAGHVHFIKEMEYPVCLLKGLGNYYFDAKPSLTGVDQDRDFDINRMRFYSEIFKKHHKELRFGSAKICNLLMDPRTVLSEDYFEHRNTRQKYKTLQQYLNDVKKIQDEITQLTEENVGYSARFEAIICVRNMLQIANDPTKIVNFFLEHKVFGQIMLGLGVKEIPSPKLGHHLTRNLMPFLNTLEFHIKERKKSMIQRIPEQQGNAPNWIEYEDPNCLSDFTIEDYFDCIAAEAVAAFTLYGNAKYRNKTPTYADWLRNFLGLKPDNFQGEFKMEQVGVFCFKKLVQIKGSEDEPERIACQYKPDLDIFSKVILENNRFKLKPKTLDPLKSLVTFSYNEKKELNRSVAKKIKHAHNVDPQKNLDMQREKMTRILFKIIVDISFHKLVDKNASNASDTLQKWDAVVTTCPANRETPVIDSEEFVRRILSTERRRDFNADYHFVRWVYGIATFFDSNDQTFKKLLGNDVEGRMLKIGQLLPVTANWIVPNRVKFTIVAPYNGLKPDDYLQMKSKYSNSLKWALRDLFTNRPREENMQMDNELCENIEKALRKNSESGPVFVKLHNFVEFFRSQNW